MSYPLSAARRRGQSAHIFPLRGRYVRLLRRSRVAGITSAPRLAGVRDTFPACALRGGERSPVPPGHRSDRRRFYLRANIPGGKHHRFPHDVRTIFLPHCALPAQSTESAGGKPFFRRAGKAAPVEKDSVAKRGFKRKRGRARRRSPPRRSAATPLSRTPHAGRNFTPDWMRSVCVSSARVPALSFSWETRRSRRPAWTKISVCPSRAKNSVNSSLATTLNGHSRSPLQSRSVTFAGRNGKSIRRSGGDRKRKSITPEKGRRKNGKNRSGGSGNAVRRLRPALPGTGFPY